MSLRGLVVRVDLGELIFCCEKEKEIGSRDLALAAKDGGEKGRLMDG